MIAGWTALPFGAVEKGFDSCQRQPRPRYRRVGSRHGAWHGGGAIPQSCPEQPCTAGSIAAYGAGGSRGRGVQPLPLRRATFRVTPCSPSMLGCLAAGPPIPPTRRSLRPSRDSQCQPPIVRVDSVDSRPSTAATQRRKSSMVVVQSTCKCKKSGLQSVREEVRRFCTQTSRAMRDRDEGDAGRRPQVQGPRAGRVLGRD